MRPDGVPLRPTDWPEPLLVAERHAENPAVPKSRSVDEGQPPHPVGHRPLQAHRVLACDDAVPLGRADSWVAGGDGGSHAPLAVRGVRRPHLPDGAA